MIRIEIVIDTLEGGLDFTAKQHHLRATRLEIEAAGAMLAAITDCAEPPEVVHEDLTDELILADAGKWPGTAKRRKGQKLKDMLFSWPLETMAPRQDPPPKEP
jgi:hypothetical protein